MSLSNFTVPTTGSTGAAIMPKLQYRFRVILSNFGTDATSEKDITENVVSVTRPGITYDETQLDVYNSRIYLIGKHTFDAVTLVLRDDVEGASMAAVNAQLSKQTDHVNQESALAGSSYKFEARIQMLNGQRPTDTAEISAGTLTGVAEEFKLEGAFLSGVQFGDMTYAASEQVQITCTIRYDNLVHVGPQGETLKSGQLNTSSTTSTGQGGGGGAGGADISPAVLSA